MTDKPKCVTAGCNYTQTARGLCNRHYYQWKLSRDRPCNIPDCKETAITKGFCPKHYLRLRRTGDPLKVREFDASSPEESFRLRTKRQGDCLNWTGSLNPNGYGEIWVDGRNMGAHRYAWMQAHGEIPEGFVMDHICHNPACCNVEHLRLATHRQNIAHQSGARKDNKSSGVRNVYRARNRWTVKIMKDGVARRFGYYDTIEEAAEVAEQARKELFGEFAGGGKP